MEAARALWEYARNYGEVFGPHLVAATALLLALWSIPHAVIHKRDSRSALMWVAFIAFVPLLGSVFYILIGINRINRRVRALREIRRKALPPAAPHTLSPDAMADALQRPSLAALARVGESGTDRPLVAGNAVKLLKNGDAAFPAMWEAIAEAEKSLTLLTYIFDSDAAGRRFVDEFKKAKDRGVQVRVLVDAVGSRYGSPSIFKLLKKAGIPHAAFMPTRLPWRFPYANLRNHRKIMVVDGHTGFTGGMNIRAGNLLKEKPRFPVADIHARIHGPAVAHLQEIFVEDWQFATGEQLSGDAYFPELSQSGPVTARGIPDGPDEDFDVLRMLLLGAVASATRSIKIATPYFIPDATLITALNVALRRGIRIDLCVPEQSNLFGIDWAMRAQLWQILGPGCSVWLVPPPFDHSKLMLVDDAWVFLGSGNWDARSLRLSFEFNLECYDLDLAAEAQRLFEDRIRRGRLYTHDDAKRRPWIIKVRDGLARLFSPYL
jgi:cardiolipin synthase